MLPGQAKSLQKGIGFSGKMWAGAGPAEKEGVASVPQSERLARTSEPPY